MVRSADVLSVSPAMHVIIWRITLKETSQMLAYQVELVPIPDGKSF